MIKKIPEDEKLTQNNVVSIQSKTSEKVAEKRSKLSHHLEQRRQSPEPPKKK